jgi:TIR domain
MKVFISWSGERSRLLAQALHWWLPLVLHYVKPWMSDADVSAGDRWSTVIAKELETSNFGIICITPENLQSPWVMFEAGALAKAMQGSKVIPLLFNLEIREISGPLAQFQAKKFNRDGVEEVIGSINKSTESGVSEERTKQLFSPLWPELEKKLAEIPTNAPAVKHSRSQHEILEELVSGVRGLDGRFRDVENMVMEQGPRMRRRFRHFHPMMIEEITHSVSKGGDDPIALLMIAGMVRDDVPWLAEVLTEAYREIRDGDAKSAQRAIERLRHFFKNMMGRDMMMEFMGPSEEAHMMMMEMPRMLDHLLHRFERRRLKPPSNPGDGADSSEQAKG